MSGRSRYQVISSHSGIANVDIVIASGDVDAGVTAHADVSLAGRVVQKRLRADGCVVVAVVIFKRSKTNTHTAAAGCSAEERLRTHGRIPRAAGKVKQGLSSLGRVAVGIASVRRRRHRLRSGQKPKAGEHEQDGKADS